MLSKKLNQYNKQMIKAFIPTIVFLLLFFIILSLLPNNTLPVVVLLIVTMLVATMLYSDVKNKNKPDIKNYFKKMISTAIIVTIFLGVMKLLGPYGLLGLIVIVLLFSVYRLVRGRKIFMGGIRNIEEELFGKSLDKKNWGEGDKPKMKKVVFK